MERYATLVAGVLLTLPFGCSAPDSRDFEYRISKAEGERGQLQLALDDERAKVVILEERCAAEQKRQELARAEVNLARDRMRQIEQANEELLKLLGQRDRAAFESPVVPASPLPPEIDRKLQAFAARHRGRVWYDRGRAALSFANDRLFEPGHDQVRSGAQALLSELAGIAALLPAPDFEMIIVGHTDDSPIKGPETLARHPSNWHLSVHRAIAFKNTLVMAGLPESRMGVMGYGAHRPLGANKARNRRVEVFFAAKGEVKPRMPVPPPPPQ